MSHTAIIALMQNSSIANDIMKDIMKDIKTFATDFVEFAICYTNILYNQLNKDKLALSSFLIIIYAVISLAEYYNYLDRIKDTEDQITYLKKKTRILEGNLEFLSENNASNELKIMKLTKQMKKLQKEVNEYA